LCVGESDQGQGQKKQLSISVQMVLYLRKKQTAQAPRLYPSKKLLPIIKFEIRCRNLRHSMTRSPRKQTKWTVPGRNGFGKHAPSVNDLTAAVDRQVGRCMILVGTDFTNPCRAAREKKASRPCAFGKARVPSTVLTCLSAVTKH
jgi:hypothetical protein